MRTWLDEKLAAQIAARFITKPDGRDTQNYTKLMKLMYLVEREALSRWNRPLTGDLLCWLDMGPVLSGVLNRIKTPFPTEVSSWSKWFEREGFDLRLTANPGDDMLAPPVCELIDSLHEKYKDYRYGRLSDHLHEILQENPAPPKGTSVQIEYEAILEAVGKGDRAKRIARRISVTNLLKSKIGDC